MLDHYRGYLMPALAHAQSFVLGLPAWVHVVTALMVIPLVIGLLRKPRMSVRGKHVLITGGSQGLGRALAEQCVQKGARVTIVARTLSKLEKAVEEISALGEIQCRTLDVKAATVADVRALMEDAAESFGRVDVFVANAGTGPGVLVLDTPSDEFEGMMEHVVATNLVGSMKCATAAAQAMSSDGRGGRISIVSSAAGLISLPGYSVYSATKFGHRGFLAGAYHEFLRRGIRLSVYYPGSIKTPGFKDDQEACALVTSKIEGQCSDVSSAASAAGCLLAGIEGGVREITNELLPALLIDTPTGSPLVDAAVGAVVQLIRVGWFAYLEMMSGMYISGVATTDSSNMAATEDSNKNKREIPAAARKQPSGGRGRSATKRTSTPSRGGGRSPSGRSRSRSTSSKKRS